MKDAREIPSLKQEVAAGVAWSGASQMLRQGLQIVITLVLAYLLSPTDYGIVGYALILISFMDTFRELGLGAAVIQNQHVTREQLNLIFWINIATGVVLAAMSIAMAPVVAWWFASAPAGQITAVLGILFIARAGEIVQRALMRKALRFKALAAADVAATLIAGVAAIVAAFAGWAYWALVLQQAVSGVVTVVLLHYWSTWRPGLAVQWRGTRRMFTFSAGVFGSGCLAWLDRNTDVFLIGTFLGASALGQYRMAYSLMMMPVRNIAWSLGNVMFPTYAKLQDDLPRLSRGYLKTTAAIALVTAPMMFGLLATAQPLASLALNPLWSDVGGLLAILALVGLVQSIGSPRGSIMLARGRSGMMLATGAVCVPLTAMGVVAGVLLRGDVYGVAWGYAIAQALVWLYWQLRTNQLLGLRMGEVYRALRWVLLAAALMSLVVLAARIAMDLGGLDAPAVQAPALVVLGVVTYAVLIRYFPVQARDDLLDIFRRRAGGKTTP